MPLVVSAPEPLFTGSTPTQVRAQSIARARAVVHTARPRARTRSLFARVRGRLLGDRTLRARSWRTAAAVLQGAGRRRGSRGAPTMHVGERSSGMGRAGAREMGGHLRALGWLSVFRVACVVCQHAPVHCACAMLSGGLYVERHALRAPRRRVPARFCSSTLSRAEPRALRNRTAVHGGHWGVRRHAALAAAACAGVFAQRCGGRTCSSGEQLLWCAGDDALEWHEGRFLRPRAAMHDRGRVR